MKNIIEKIFYYLMAVCFMNIIFLIRMLPEYILNFEYRMNICSWVCFGIVAAITLIGIIASILIVAKPLKFKKNTLGIEYQIIDFKNHTGEQYFTHFSLLVLTAFAIPYTQIIFDVIFILLIHALLCFIYIRENLFYINPVLNLLKYRIYECKCINIKTNDPKTIYVFAKNIQLEKNMILKLKSLNTDIVRIREKKTTK